MACTTTTMLLTSATLDSGCVCACCSSSTQLYLPQKSQKDPPHNNDKLSSAQHISNWPGYRREGTRVAALLVCQQHGIFANTSNTTCRLYDSFAYLSVITATETSQSIQGARHKAEPVCSIHFHQCSKTVSITTDTPEHRKSRY